MTSGQNQKTKNLIAIGLFALTNVAAYFLIIGSLNSLHSLGINNAWFIPDSFRWENGRVRQNLNQWNRLSAGILVIEWLLFIYLLYRLNRWVVRSYFQFTKLPVTLLVTATVAITTAIQLTTTLVSYLLSSLINQDNAS